MAFSPRRARPGPTHQPNRHERGALSLGLAPLPCGARARRRRLATQGQSFAFIARPCHLARATFLRRDGERL